MRPDIMLERGDIEVAGEDVGGIVVDAACRASRRISSRKASLWANLGLRLGIGEVAAGRDIEAVNPGQAVAGQADGDMAGVILAAELAGVDLGEGQARQYGGTVVAGLAALGDMGVAAGGEQAPPGTGLRDIWSPGGRGRRAASARGSGRPDRPAGEPN